MRIRPSVVMLALALAAGPVRAPAADPEPLRIPTIVSLTGVAAFIGKNEQQAFAIAEKTINARGGINGRPVHFDVTDDTSSGQVALQLVSQIGAATPLFIGPGLTQDCNAVAPVVRDRGPAEWCLSPGVNPPPGSNIWSSSVSLVDCAKVMMRYFHQRGLNRMAILSSTDATGQEIDRDFDLAHALPEFRDVEFVAHEHFNLSDVSVAAQVAKIKAARPQALLTWTLGPPFGTLLHGVADGGLDVPVGASNGDMIYEQLAQYAGFMPKELDFVAVLASAHDTLGKGPVRDAQAAYLAAFKAAGVRPSFVHTLAWDPAFIVVDAYRHLGSGASPQQFRDYINHLHGWVGINGIYDFRDGSQRGIGANAAIMERWDPATNDFSTVSKRAGELK
jgi:branched-chain amino acid transport system substrate-binding protein